MKCLNCGAIVEVTNARCPHCNAMLYPGAEKKYMEELGGMKNELEGLAKHPMKKILKRCSFAGAGTLLVVCLVMSILLIHQRKAMERKRQEDLKQEQDLYEQLMWENANFPQLDTWYEEGDYASILNFRDSLYTGDSSYDIGRWRHAPFVDIYDYYDGILTFQQMIDTKQSIKNYQVGGALYDAMNLWYRCSVEALADQVPKDEENADWGLTRSEVATIQEYRKQAWSLLTEQLHMSGQEIEDLYENCVVKGYVSACYDYAEANTWEVEQ